MYRILVFGFLASLVGCHSENKPKVESKGEANNQARAGGSYEVRGEKDADGHVFHVSSKNSSNATEQFDIEIEWPVTQLQFDDLKQGQSTFRVKNILELKRLDLTPNGKNTRFKITFKKNSAVVTLEFAGYPDAELASKSASGLK